MDWDEMMNNNLSVKAERKMNLTKSELEWAKKTGTLDYYEDGMWDSNGKWIKPTKESKIKYGRYKKHIWEIW